MSDDVVAYVNQLPEEARKRVEKVRQLVREASPAAVEAMNYGLVGYKLGGRPLIYVGGFARHIGLYATPTGHEAFAEEFARYKQGKGSVQLPLDEPLPVDLISRVIAHRVATVSEELPAIGAPATRALAGIGVTQMSQLGAYSAGDLLALHGVGPKAITILTDAGAVFAPANN